MIGVIVLNNIVLVSAVSIILLLLFSLKGTKKQFNTINPSNYLSIEQTNWLRGFAIVMVVYSHYYPVLGLTYGYGPISHILGFGFIGVAIFLFLSGYAIMISKLRKPDYLNHFIPKRMLRLYIPFLISYIVFVIIMYCTGVRLSLNNILDIPFMSLPGVLNWYLKVQLVLYIVFYLLALFIKDNKRLTVSLLALCFVFMLIGYICQLENYWYQSSFLFPVGMLFAIYKEKLFNIVNRKYILSFCISVLFFMISFIPYYLYGGVIFETIFILGTTQFLLCVCIKTSGNSKIISYLGTISLELYLAHLVVLNAVRDKLNYEENILTFIIYLAVSILFAILVNKMGTVIIKKINNKFNI